MRKSKILILLVLSFAISSSFFAQEEGGTQRPEDCPYSVNSEHFVVHYNDELNDISLEDRILAYA
jgi:hypothetical protein